MYDVFQENGTSYYVMDYIDGKSLHQILKDNGPLSEAQAIRYIKQVSEALEYVLSKNILHLDIKPGNILIDKNDNAILIDFGAAKHYDEGTGENTTTMQGLNTPGYAPIEQSMTGFTNFSPATDIYALGATLYKLLSGTTPPNSIALQAGEEKLLPIVGVSETTASAIQFAMQSKRMDRPQSISEFISSFGTNITTKNSAADPKPIEDESTIIETTNHIQYLGKFVKMGMNLTRKKRILMLEKQDSILPSYWVLCFSLWLLSLLLFLS